MSKFPYLVRSLPLLLLLSSHLGAQSTSGWQIGPFSRPPGLNPIITPKPASTFPDPRSGASIHWEALHTFNPAAVVRDGKVYLLYRAEDDTGTATIGGHTSRLGFAESTDGLHFTRSPQPVFYPALDDQREREWPGGVEDPRVVEAPDGTYVLTYTQWNGSTYDVGIATSKDLTHWEKHGPAFFTAADGKYASLKYKSAGILTTLQQGRLVAARLQGKFWMYWGEGDIHLATSSDLIHWTPIEDAAGRPLVLLSRRAGLFDSGFPEVGPPPVLTSAGIVLIYNGKNAVTNAGGKSLDGTRTDARGAPGIAPGAYAAGEALFSKDDPSHLLQQTQSPLLKPEEAYEKAGQYAAGTTFAEGLIFFGGHWLLYYGCADSLVAVVGTPGP